MKKLFPAFLLLVLTLTLTAQDEFTLVKKGMKVPQFTFTPSPAKTSRISDYEGKVVLIFFFATWCGPCRAELPRVDKEIYQTLKENNDFALLVFGREHDWKTVEKFRKDQGFSMPLYPDPERKIYEQFAVQQIPRNFLLNKKGEIVYMSTGFNETEFGRLKKTLHEALN
jgi:peroxiredoxin